MRITVAIAVALLAGPGAPLLAQASEPLLGPALLAAAAEWDRYIPGRLAPRVVYLDPGVLRPELPSADSAIDIVFGTRIRIASLDSAYRVCTEGDDSGARVCRSADDGLAIRILGVDTTSTSITVRIGAAAMLSRAWGQWVEVVFPWHGQRLGQATARTRMVT